MKRIAAGEVVERPASVIKELLENSIDAGATQIRLILKGSGLELIQVIDNGEGMGKEDILICAERHATSKIARSEDLDRIVTFGFRGEALASIGSVSRMTIIAKTQENDVASLVKIEYSEMKEISEIAADTGCSVSVQDLFGAVPARRKFLKSPATELKHAITMFRRIALSHPEIDFMLYVNDERTLDLRKTTLENRMRELMGRNKMGRLIPVEKSYGNMAIEGFISRPGEFLRSRDDQFFFLNRRYFQNRSLMHAVISAYGPRLGKMEYPAFVLFIDMEPDRYDVNVHPTKIEVRFADERYVHDALRRALVDSLRTRHSVPEFHLVKNPTEPSGHHTLHSTPAERGQLTLDIQRPLDEGDSQHAPLFEEKPQFWQIHNKYIFSQIKSGLTMIDQHAAHERILYEKALKTKASQPAASQQLLFPQTLLFAFDDYVILTEIIPYLNNIGFGIHEFGNNTVMIDSVPVEVRRGDETQLISEILDEYKENRVKSNDAWDTVAKSYACKAAIKAGDSMKSHEMASLMDQLFATKDPYFCPHGRPVVMNIGLEEIDKRFGR